MPWAVTVNPNAWREGLSEGISHLSFSPAFAQKISKGVSITTISWASQELSGLSTIIAILIHISEKSLTFILHISFQLWLSSGIWSWYTRGITKIQMGRFYRPSNLCGGRIETEKYLGTVSNVTVLHSVCIVGSASSLSGTESFFTVQILNTEENLFSVSSLTFFWSSPYIVYMWAWGNFPRKPWSPSRNFIASREIKIIPSQCMISALSLFYSCKGEWKHLRNWSDDSRFMERITIFQRTLF